MAVCNQWLLDDSQELLEEYLTEFLSSPVRLDSSIHTIDDIIRRYATNRKTADPITNSEIAFPRTYE